VECTVRVGPGTGGRVDPLGDAHVQLPSDDLDQGLDEELFSAIHTHASWPHDTHGAKRATPIGEGGRGISEPFCRRRMGR
jgi:hypothetical protein